MNRYASILGFDTQKTEAKKCIVGKPYSSRVNDHPLTSSSLPNIIKHLHTKCSIELSKHNIAGIPLLLCLLIGSFKVHKRFTWRDNTRDNTSNTGNDTYYCIVIYHGSVHVECPEFSRKFENHGKITSWGFFVIVVFCFVLFCFLFIFCFVLFLNLMVHPLLTNNVCYFTFIGCYYNFTLQFLVILLKYCPNDQFRL